ncbi:hypothetical protein [Butyricimonas paravirosa]|uniref:hypothetical protein n=2 Tax=Butyricimonas paravirosa TaxID=1472417 RepID=UPI0022E84463|nr:hypothetical protein [Butyricimonas paravirosa]
MNQQGTAFLMLLLPIIKIGITIWAVYRAKELNRSRWGWGIFTFFLTLPAFIILLCLGKKKDNSSKKIDSFPISKKIANKIPFISLEVFKQHLINKNWVLLRNSEGHRQVYIFQKDQTLLISQAGEVDKGRWEEVGDNSILIEVDNKSTLYKPTHETEHLLILKVDGKEEYLHFVDEKLYEKGYKTTDKINELIGVLAESEQKRKNEKDNMVFILIFLGIPLIIFTIIAIIQS